jgi:foldase protein PrsA
MQSPRLPFALCALLLPAAIAAGCGGLPSGSVATVDGEPIDRTSLDHWMAVAAKTGGQSTAAVPKPPDFAECIAQKRTTEPKPPKGEKKKTDTHHKDQCKQEYETLRNQAMQLLISSQWIEGEASDRGISVSEADVRKRFEELKKQSFPKDAEYQKFLEDSGQSEKDILLRVRFDLLQTKVRDQVTKGKDKVSEKQIAGYYKDNKADFGQPAQRDLRIVMTETKAKAVRAKAALDDGRPWKAVAKRFSIDQASRSEGGSMKAVAEGQQEKPLDEAIFAAAKDELTGPIETPFGFYVFEVTKVQKGTQQTLVQAKPTIKQLLTSEAEQKAVDAFTQEFRKKWKERTDCLEGFEMLDCSNGPDDPPAPVQ